MDKISLVGLTLGIAAIVVGQVLEGGHLSSLFQPTAFLIVVGGTLGAVMLQSPLRTFVDGMRMGRWVFVPPVVSPETIIDQVASWSAVARKEGLLTLENQIDALPDPFMRKGLQLLVDGVEPNRLREVLEVEIGVWENQMKRSARIWEAAGGYAPTIGILGAVMGLIHVMENLSDPSRLGAGIAVAFVATIYGVASPTWFPADRQEAWRAHRHPDHPARDVRRWPGGDRQWRQPAHHRQPHAGLRGLSAGDRPCGAGASSTRNTITTNAGWCPTPTSSPCCSPSSW
jgi:Flagellar motor component